MKQGVVYKLLNDIYQYLGIAGDFAETKQRIIRIRLSLKTGLSMNKFLQASDDNEEEVLRIIEALKSPEFGLQNFSFNKYS